MSWLLQCPGSWLGWGRGRWLWATKGQVYNPSLWLRCHYSPPSLAPPPAHRETWRLVTGHSTSLGNITKEMSLLNLEFKWASSCRDRCLNTSTINEINIILYRWSLSPFLLQSSWQLSWHFSSLASSFWPLVFSLQTASWWCQFQSKKAKKYIQSKGEVCLNLSHKVNSITIYHYAKEEEPGRSLLSSWQKRSKNTVGQPQRTQRFSKHTLG